MAKFLFTSPSRNALGASICESAGIDPNHVRRIVIDLQLGEPGKAYIELLADDSMLDVNLGEIGVQIVELEEV